MTVAVGIFDLLTYAIPGGIYLTLLGYLAIRVGLIEATALNSANGVLLLIGVVVLSYLLGFLGYPVGAMLNRLVPRQRRDPRAEFRRRNPAAHDRGYVRADSFLLLSGLQLHDMEAAAEVNRLRASGLMSRNTAPAVALAAVTALVEVFTGGHPLLAGICAVAFAGGSLALVVQGRRLGYWASMKTLELCFWLPGVDDRTASGTSGSAQP